MGDVKGTIQKFSGMTYSREDTEINLYVILPAEINNYEDLKLLGSQTK